MGDIGPHAGDRNSGELLLPMAVGIIFLAVLVMGAILS
jgi:hypothetical protein